MEKEREKLKEKQIRVKGNKRIWGKVKVQKSRKNKIKNIEENRQE